MEVSDLWKREHGTGNDMEDVRQAMREANARRDRRWRSVGRVIGEAVGIAAALIVVLTALGLVGKVLYLTWQWILAP
jgi:hypothetical protein